MGTLSTLRRAAGSPPPLAEGRTALASAIGAKAAADERVRVLETVRSRAYSAVVDAEAVLATARTDSEQASRRAHEHNIAALLGKPPPAIPTRREAEEKLRAAHDAAADAEAAWRAIGAEIDAIQGAARDRDQRIHGAAVAVLREEGAPVVEALVGELTELHRRLVERHRFLAWLIRAGVTVELGPAALPGVSELCSRAGQPPMNWSVWRGESEAAANWEKALGALQRDPTAALP